MIISNNSSDSKSKKKKNLSWVTQNIQKRCLCIYYGSSYSSDNGQITEKCVKICYITRKLVKSWYPWNMVFTDWLADHWRPAVQTHLQAQTEYPDPVQVLILQCLLMIASLKVDDFICWLQIFPHKQSTHLHLIFSLMSSTAQHTCVAQEGLLFTSVAQCK